MVWAPCRLMTVNSTCEPVAGKVDYSIQIAPVSVPDLVDRPQMVLRVDASRVTFAEQSRWAEPLKSAIGRALAGNLAQLLPGSRVAAYPQTTGIMADYQLLVEVQTFDSVPGTGISLEVLWTLKSAKTKKEKGGRSTVKEPVDGKDPALLVAAHERALATLSREIAAAVRNLQ